MAGMQIKIRIDVCPDRESGYYYATSNDIGLAVEGESIEKVLSEIRAAVPSLLLAEHTDLRPKTDVILHDDCAIA